MERHSRGGDFYRPPPTSPRGHPKKKLRREGPPRWQDDTEWARRPRSVSPQADRFRGDDDARESKPLHLGGYLIESDLNIRGKSHMPPESETGSDNDPDSNSLGNLERTFVSTAQSIFAHVQNIKSIATNSGYSPTHPIPRAVLRIQEQLDRLNDVYDAIGDEVDRMVGELDQSAEREESLRKELDDCKTTNFKLTCGKKDLSEEVRDLKSAAAETEVELRRLKSDKEDREAEHARLEASVCELQEERRKTGAEKLWLEDTVRKRDLSFEKASADNRRMESLVKERDEEVEGLKSNNLGLQSLVQQREAEAEAARAESLRLQGLIRTKDAQIASLAAAPITPLSPRAPSGQFFYSAGPALTTAPRDHALPPRTSSPLPYIKQEAPDSTPPGVTQVPPVLPAEKSQALIQPLSHLGAGAADVLGRLFDIDQATPYDNPLLTRFLNHLGAAPEASSITITQSTTTQFWTLSDPWTTHSPPQPNLRGSLEEQFTHLCLLFPDPDPDFDSDYDDVHEDNNNDSDNENDNDTPNPFTVHLLTSLLTALTKADYSTSPRAAWAFLQAMSVPPPLLPRPPPVPASAFPSTSTPPPTTATQTALLRMMLAELCRALAAALQMTPGPMAAPLWWRQRQQQLDGIECQVSPVPRLAGLLRDVDRFVAADGGLRALRDGLGGCGDGFCSFPYSDGQSGEREKEVGLLHCGGGSSSFLMIDFGERSLRVVECRLAGMRPNAAEPRKLDLIVVREGHGENDGAVVEEELFRLAAAPRDVAAFWVKYAMGDD
ncbi:hypothetical protein F5144DRAFT_215078 [Chaetomium tenue]|uniref:Uncharacterized protein n=1 Tax=Chaetomium tenue TaxID=1854479 RepID=A0ACB7P916_9PEZI|nr:hypothetical protein F5144DRAFT_215078 [Chaetomium globosum]